MTIAYRQVVHAGISQMRFLTGKLKLKTIKKEFLRFSKYNIKESFNSFVVWYMAQAFRIKNGFNQG